MLRGYTSEDLLKRFPDDDSVLEAIMTNTTDSDRRLLCPTCHEPKRYYRVRGRKCYECGKCGHQHYPLAGTVMANTKLPLRKWLKAINLFHTHRSGLSACTLQREIEVTYKVAWRMLHQLRSLMADGGDLLQGVVEIDETYVGGRKHPGSRKQHIPKKTAVFGTLERGGWVRATAVARVDKPTIFTLIKQNVAAGSTVYSDEHSLYTHLPSAGYTHASVLHKQHEWKRGPVSTNGMEAYWSKVKRLIRGAHVAVSERWLQRYLDECSFRHNRRKCPGKVQDDLLNRLLRPLPARPAQGPPGLFQPRPGRQAK